MKKKYRVGYFYDQYTEWSLSFYLKPLLQKYQIRLLCRSLAERRN